MEFDPVFSLLPKFSIHFETASKSEAEVQLVSQYLGVDLPTSNFAKNLLLLKEALQDQNRYLTTELENESIFYSIEYSKSSFIREIVANNRINRAKRAERTR